MSMATLLQTCLLAGVFIPLASFLYLALFGHFLPRRAAAPAAHGHDAHGHGHDDHAHALPPGSGEPYAGWIATAAIGASLVLAIVAVLVYSSIPLEQRAGLQVAAAESAVTWIEIGNVPVQFGVQLDSLTLIVYLMVTICATCIHVFSIGYMQGEKRFHWFFAYLSLFCFSMLGLVIARSLIFLFVFWELVGVCSYFLIGFWFEKRSASNAAIKAFVVNRVGDFGFMIGLLLAFTWLGTLSLDGAAAVFEAGAIAAGWIAAPPTAAAAAVSPEVAAHAAQLFTGSFMGIAFATWMGVGLFCGAIGKSAQVPLQVWLPDAMEGPTPVSALIHAATMVAAGVYLVARVFLLLTPAAQFVIAVVGCITLTMAALIAIVQTDIKRVLAYSTLSQLGYMIFGLGVGAWVGALFHLLTHAFFKALLFLGSGQVIAGCHHEQDMRHYGGLWKKMPNTALAFGIAVLAISGAGIPWTAVGLGGFYSKDEILGVSYHRYHDWARPAVGGPARGESAATDPATGAKGLHVTLVAQHDAGGHASPANAEAQHGPAAHTGAGHSAEAGHAGGEHGATDYAGRYGDKVPPLPQWMWLLPVIIAYVTPFYMGRCYVLTFLGRPRNESIHAHAHESPLMYRPLLVLAFMTIVSGLFLFRSFVAYAAPVMPQLVPAINGHDHALEAAHAALPVLVGFAWVLGLGLAWLVYRNGFALATRLRGLPIIRQIHAVLMRKFFFDEVYGVVFVGGVKAIAYICRYFDAWIVDGLVNTLAYLGERIARFSGVVVDNGGVDGTVNGFGRLLWNVGGALRSVQTGVIRSYILLAAAALAALVVSLWSIPTGVLLFLFAVLGVIAARLPGGRRRLASEP